MYGHAIINKQNSNNVVPKSEYLSYYVKIKLNDKCVTLMNIYRNGNEEITVHKND